MYIQPVSLSSLTRQVGERLELELKRDIQMPARSFKRRNPAPWIGGHVEVDNGDDAAAIRQPDGSYLLLASDGMRADFVAADPWFAGYSVVMVNISDIAAMGGRPWALVDVLYVGGAEGERIVQGMKAASEAFGVPVVGGHTCRIEGQSLVSASILGCAKKLIAGDGAQPGHELVCAVDLRGSFRGPIAFNAATTADPVRLRGQIGLLAELAEEGLVDAGKDISNAGLCGTLAMLLEASGAGASIDLESIPAPDGVDPLRWLMAFPSFGFVLSVAPEQVENVCSRFSDWGIAAASIGTVTQSSRLTLTKGRQQCVLLDTREPLTGFFDQTFHLSA